jgi:hypothetical protein
MPKLIISIARQLLHVANTYAECMMARVAQPAIRQQDSYRSNLGGWN